MSATAQALLTNYHNQIGDVLFNSTYYPDEASVVQAFEAKAQAAYNAASTANLSTFEKEQLMAAFLGAKSLMWDAYDWVNGHYPYPGDDGGAPEIADPGTEVTGYGLLNPEGVDETSDTLTTTMGIFGKKSPRFWRAVVRVVLAVAVTAAVIAIPVSLMALATASPLGIGTLISGVLLKGVTVGSFTVQAALGTGLYAGFKNAEKNWDYPWQGASEFVFGLKIKPVYQ